MTDIQLIKDFFEKDEYNPSLVLNVEKATDFVDNVYKVHLKDYDGEFITNISIQNNQVIILPE